MPSASASASPWPRPSHPGYNLPTTVVAGPHCEYRINGGMWTGEPGMIEQDQTLQMRHLSNKPARSVRRTHLHVGGVTGHFTTRTFPGGLPGDGQED